MIPKAGWITGGNTMRAVGAPRFGRECRGAPQRAFTQARKKLRADDATEHKINSDK